MEEKINLDIMRCQNCINLLEETKEDGEKTKKYYYCKLRYKQGTDSDIPKKNGVYDYERTNLEDSCSLFERDKTLNEAYLNIIDILREYVDLKEEYYPLVSLWIIGTYFHDNFLSYPFLFLNAMRGSGKTRTLKLITKLSKDGEVQASLTEAVLFRTTGTLGLDEFEGVSRKGGENLRELLNASYKKGTKIKRMKEKRTPEGMERVVEEFDVYRPIAMANIFGMEEVLGDRCITLILERSSKPEVYKKVEIYEYSKIFKETKKLLELSSKKCSLCSVVALQNVYEEWNNFITNNYNNTLTPYTTYNYTNYTQAFKRLNLMELNGRDLELILPLILISQEISEKCQEDLFLAINNYTSEKRDDQFAESQDISLIDFVSQETNDGFQRIKDLTNKFKEFLQYEKEDDDWLNTKWIGRALKRLRLLKEKKRLGRGVEVRLDIEKAQEKIKIFK
jgi:hypothetical protein